MKQKVRIAMALLPVLAFFATMTPLGGNNGGGNVCVIGGDIVVCAPTNDPPS